MKTYKNESEFFIPLTDKAKDLLDKIKLFNELNEYFKSDECKNILNNDFNIVQNDVLKFEDSESDYIYFKEGKIDYGYRHNKAYLAFDFNKVNGNGKLGKLFYRTFNQYDDIYENLTNLGNKFKPTFKYKNKIIKDCTFKGLKYSPSIQSEIDRLVLINKIFKNLNVKLKFEIWVKYNTYENIIEDIQYLDIFCDKYLRDVFNNNSELINKLFNENKIKYDLYNWIKTHLYVDGKEYTIKKS